MWEWNETAYDGSNNTADEVREFRGGSWGADNSIYLDASISSFGYVPTNEFDFLGFRVAMIPEPSSLSLLALGGVVGFASRRLLKRRS